MRIGFDAKRAFHNFSGLGNYSRNIINQLAIFYPDNEYFLYNPKKVTGVNGFPPEKSFLRFPDKLFYKHLSFLWRSYGINAVLNKDSLDIYHGLSNELPFGIKKFSGKKIITIHDLIFLRFPDFYKSADRYIYTKKFKCSVGVADAIIAISDQTKKDIIHFSGIDPSRIEVIYQDCDPVFYAQKMKNEELERIRKKYSLPKEYILYVGTIEKRKNLLSLFKAIQKFEINLPVVVAGKPTNYKNQVVRFLAENKVKNVYFFENIPQKDLPAIYRNSILFVYPSSFEGFGIPIIEALNSEIPVITSKGSCMEETGGKGSLYIDPANIEELGNAILKVLGNSDLQREMRKEGMEHVKKFRPRVTINQLMKLYAALL